LCHDPGPLAERFAGPGIPVAEAWVVE
jgi:hypothetical protein